MFELIRSLKRGWYVNQIISHGIVYFRGKQIHEMTDKELKLVLTLLKAARKGALDGHGIT